MYYFTKRTYGTTNASSMAPSWSRSEPRLHSPRQRGKDLSDQRLKTICITSASALASSPRQSVVVPADFPSARQAISAATTPRIYIQDAHNYANAHIKRYRKKRKPTTVITHPLSVHNAKLKETTHPATAGHAQPLPGTRGTPAGRAPKPPYAPHCALRRKPGRIEHAARAAARIRRTARGKQPRVLIHRAVLV
ncbi:hypothetical protein SCY_0094 [Saccharomyces cerevisiae YJM789]|uniref:Uncharacterized protein n=1 Tax=Saccharomyces cerevisiae (strain YJM789) TaxID=307796 RepID=A7A0I3_YEAS7|nr:hypothetical protein SCY_0094 [Saccharomyces cerevisiae YJM789]